MMRMMDATANVGQQVRDALRRMRAPEFSKTEWKRIANDLWASSEVMLTLADGRRFKFTLRQQDGKVIWMEIGKEVSNRCLKRRRT